MDSYQKLKAERDELAKQRDALVDLVMKAADPSTMAPKRTLRDAIDHAFDRGIEQPTDTPLGAALIGTLITKANRRATEQYIFGASDLQKSREDAAAARKARRDAREYDGWGRPTPQRIKRLQDARDKREAEGVRKALRGQHPDQLPGDER
jgi:hypothetical protein